MGYSTMDDELATDAARGFGVGAIERFEHAFLARRKQRPPSRSLAFTEAGLVLGAGTVVAPMSRDGGWTLDLSGEDRILALLAVAFSGQVNPAVLAKLRRAAEVWAQGDKSLAQILLEYLRLPKLKSEEQAFGLFLADRLIASGLSPRDLCEALGFDLPEGLKKYNPDEPRDEHGRWTTGGANGTQPAAAARAAPGPDLNPAHTSYQFNGNIASQTSTNPDGTSVVSTWTLNRGSGLTETDQIRLANGDIAATSITDAKATQTLSLSEAGTNTGLVIAQPPAGDPILIPAGAAASTGTTLLEDAGTITHIGRWFMTGAEAGALGAAFYFGSTTPAGPEDETTPVGAGDQFRILSNADTVGALVQRNTPDGWVNTG
ncbi:MAG: hypothetical protein WBF43_07955, partial [Methylocella sp.]